MLEDDEMKPLPWSTSMVDAVGRGFTIFSFPPSTWFNDDHDDYNNNGDDDNGNDDTDGGGENYVCEIFF